ncbi:hypothetical protein DPMN_170009 [Dreissena polymorpha]|uniref:Uncharacterized protein n=1 Tax=Dreissena polymorpha TaxID=45954 RepID=A0A9D4DX31_DREPO|nr:hypothetical protein DPMN_170009 [Dreissena polymorpha]
MILSDDIRVEDRQRRMVHKTVQRVQPLAIPGQGPVYIDGLRFLSTLLAEKIDIVVTMGACM